MISSSLIGFIDSWFGHDSAAQFIFTDCITCGLPWLTTVCLENTNTSLKDSLLHFTWLWSRVSYANISMILIVLQLWCAPVLFLLGTLWLVFFLASTAQSFQLGSIRQTLAWYMQKKLTCMLLHFVETDSDKFQFFPAPTTLINLQLFISTVVNFSKPSSLAAAIDVFVAAWSARRPIMLLELLRWHPRRSIWIRLIILLIIHVLTDELGAGPLFWSSQQILRLLL